MVLLPSRCKARSPCAVARSPSARMKSPDQSARGPLPTSFKLLPGRSGLSRRAARRPPCAEIASISTVRRSEENTSELQSLMRISYAVLCLKQQKNDNKKLRHNHQTTYDIPP